MTDTLPVKRYAPDEIELGLQVMARFTLKEAAKQTNVPATTLKDWAYKSHRERYLELRQQRQGEEAKELAIEFADVTRAALDKQREAVEMIDLESLRRQPAMLAQTAMNLGKTAATSIDKAQLLRDRPTQIVQSRSVEEVLDSLDRKVGEYVDSTAEEMAA